MATYTKQFLSASSLGKPIEISAVASPGTTIHEATATGNFDEIHLYAWNQGTASMILNLEWGGTASANRLQMTITPNDFPYLVAPGWPIGSTDAVKAYGTATGRLFICGYANRVI